MILGHKNMFLVFRFYQFKRIFEININTEQLNFIKADIIGN